MCHPRVPLFFLAVAAMSELLSLVVGLPLPVARIAAAFSKAKLPPLPPASLEESLIDRLAMGLVGVHSVFLGGRPHRGNMLQTLTFNADHLIQIRQFVARTFSVNAELIKTTPVRDTTPVCDTNTPLLVIQSHLFPTQSHLLVIRTQTCQSCDPNIHIVRHEKKKSL